MLTETEALPEQTKGLQDPVVQEILGDLYKPDKILAQKVENTGLGEVKITFVFPPYERTLQPLDHVSMSQMHEALLDGLYCSIGQAIKDGTISKPIDFETFQKRKLDSIFYRESLTFRKMLTANEPSELTFKIIKVEEKKLVRLFSAVTVQIDGFMRGEVECLLEKPE